MPWYPFNWPWIEVNVCITYNAVGGHSGSSPLILSCATNSCTTATSLSTRLACNWQTRIRIMASSSGVVTCSPRLSCSSRGASKMKKALSSVKLNASLWAPSPSSPSRHPICQWSNWWRGVVRVSYLFQELCRPRNPSNREGTSGVQFASWALLQTAICLCRPTIKKLALISLQLERSQHSTCGFPLTCHITLAQPHTAL